MSTVYHSLAASNFSQDWTNVGTLITTANDWGNVPSIMGYRGDGLSTVATDPQTVTADGSATPLSALLLGSTPTTSGAVGVFQSLANPVVAFQGSGTASAPHLVLHLDATGRQNLQISYLLRDLDNNGDNAMQAVALQYRIGESGPFINVPAAFVADASDGPNLTKETTVTVTLPAEVNGAAKVQVRIITNDATGSDEWIGIDDIVVSSVAAPPVGPNLTYTGSINETAAFDGTVEGVITITLTGDTFTGTDGQPLAGATVDNLPGGLFATVTKISDTVAELRVTGTAAGDHAIDVNNLTVTFANAAFAGNDAAAIANATKSDLKIDFATEGAAPTQEFKAKTGSNLNVSDASTAIALDANYMVVGDDEASVLRVFHREGGEALVEWDYSGLLENGGELDLEGGTLVGDTYYFTGSHSNNKSGNESDTREYIFAVKIDGTGADAAFNWVGKKSGLEQVLIDWDTHSNGGQFGFAIGAPGKPGNANGIAPENVAGFSIEGLTVNQAGDGLLLGFRAPQSSTVTRDKAVIVELALGTPDAGNPTGIGGVVQAIELNLGGRGIRSIEKAADGSGYLILAGPAGGASDEVTHDFRLFRWTGDAASQPVELDVALDALRETTGGSLESIVDVLSTDSGTWVQLLQDVGDNATYGKDAPKASQKFIGNWVQIGANVDQTGTAPVLKSSTPADESATASATADIVLKFDEGVKADIGNFVIYKANDDSVVETIAANSAQVTIAFNTVTINPTADLAAGTAYYVKADNNAITDHYGNAWGGISDATTLNFATSAAPLPKVLITEINSNQAADAAGGDFFEIYNYGSTAISLDNWTWKNLVASGSPAEYKGGTFNGVTIEAGGKLVVLTNGGVVADFKTAYGLDASVAVVAVGAKGLGQNEGVALFDATGMGVAGINYSTSAKTLSGAGFSDFTVQPMQLASGTAAGGHAGANVGGSATASAVWDGASVTNPTYKPAVVGEDGAKAQTVSADSVGSPGVVPKPKVLITEINSNATGGDFFEIYNYGSTAIDLTDWQWVHSGGTDIFTFAADSTIAAGGKLVVLTNDGDVASFKTAWGLDASVNVIALGTKGLGQNEGVALLDATGNGVTGLNYGTASFTAGGLVVSPLKYLDGVTPTNSKGGHAGAAANGGAKASAVWDGLSTTDPTYKAATAGQDGARAQSGDGASIGSPGALKAAAPSYTNNFDSAANFADFTVFSKDANTATNVDWRLNSGGADINGYNSTVPANDWLISKAFNLNETSAEFLSFTTWTRYTDGGLSDPAQQLKLFYSTNYSGTGDPAAATWTELSFERPAANSQVTTPSGLIDLSAISGTNVFFAFQYQSSANRSASNWRVDDFKIESYTGAVLSVAATDAVKPEGDSGATDYTFTVTRAGDTTGASAVNWAVTGSGASPADAVDFVGGTLPSGTVNFAAGETTKTITVSVQGDTTTEQDEGFTVTLSGATSATVIGATAQGTIVSEEPPITKIHAIQGSTDTALLMASIVTIEGIVTGYAPGLLGFYVQEEDADHDADASTSEGIFVYFGSNFTIPGLSAASIGDTVRVKGTVADYKGQTQLAMAQAAHYTMVSDGTAANLPAPVQIKLPVSSLMDWEAVEGMLVEISSATSGGSLIVTDNYNLGRYGQVTLTSDELQMQFTETNTPDVAGFAAHNAAIQKDQIILDDLSSAQNPDTHIGRGGQPLSASNTLRAGDAVDKIVGVVDQFVDAAAGAYETSYRIQPTDTVSFTGAPRPTAADLPVAVTGAEIKVVSANVLNYFTTLGTASFTNPNGTSHRGRGATDPTEFVRQKDKIVANLLGLDADVLGLMEVQNNGFADGTSAIDSLVDALNAVAGAGTYAYVAGPFNDGAVAGDAATAGNDAIMSAIVYKPGKVTPVGQAAVADPLTYDAFSATFGNRVPLAQTFRSNADNEVFTVVVNHFKSKGSVNDPDLGNGQGANNLARMEAARDLLAWLGTNPTGSADSDILLLGDFNAYSKEDPITWLDANGFNKVSTGLSYSFDGLWGSLDHALASDSLTSSVTGAVKWAINAEEPALLDYNMEFKSDAQDASYYAADAYRSSDHNPILIGLNLNTAPTLSGLPGSAQSVTVGTAANLADFAVADFNGDTLTVALSATNGSIGGLSAGNAGGVTVTAVAGGFTLNGAAAGINTLLAGTTFTAAAAGSASIAVSVNDGQGGSASGSYAMSTSNPVQVSVPRASTNNPSIAELLNASGHLEYTPELVTRAMHTLYGNIGANLDVRNWSVIMQSSNPLQASEDALRAMYQDSDYLVRNTQHLEQSGYGASQAEFTYRQMADRLDYTYDAGWSNGTVYDYLGDLVWG